MIFYYLNINGKVCGLNDQSLIKHQCEQLGASDKFIKDVLEQAESFANDPLSGSKMLIGGRETYSMRKTDFGLENFNTFLDTYYRELEATWSPETHRLGICETFMAMQKAIVDGKFGKDSQAIKNTCKVLKIKHTYKAIQAYLEGK